VSAGPPVPGSTVERVNPVIVLNGGSSSGKTSIARSLQRLLGTTWMTLGVDDLIRALPGGEEIDALVRAQQDGGAPVRTQGPVEFGPDGAVAVNRASPVRYLVPARLTRPKVPGGWHGTG